MRSLCCKKEEREGLFSGKSKEVRIFGNESLGRRYCNKEEEIRDRLTLEEKNVAASIFCLERGSTIC